MKLKKLAVTIDGVAFHVQEMAVGNIMPLLTKLQSDEQSAEAQMQIMADCVLEGGKAIGVDGVQAMGLAMYMQLVPHVMAINGLDDRAGKLKAAS